MKVMIRVPNWVGDAVMAEPALRQLRRIFNDAHITFVARPWVAGLFDGENLYDDLIPVADAGNFFQSTKRFINEARTLQRQAFDYAVLLTNSFRTAFSARAASIPQIAGYATDLRGVLLHRPIAFEKDYKAKHQVFYYLNIAIDIERSLSKDTWVDLQNPKPQLQATAESLDKARFLLAEAGIEVKSQESGVKSQESELENPQAAIGASALRNAIVALNPGATNSRAKQWLAERFAQTADTLAERDGLQTIIIGAAGDVEAANQVASLMRTPVANLAGRTSIAELKAVLSLCSLMISNDTGPAHVSAALGVPTVVVFGPTEHFATRPFADCATVVRQDVDCSPCMLKDCPIDHRCMTGVEVNTVYLAAKKLLSV
jgi:heptosyltransferase-2